MPTKQDRANVTFEMLISLFFSVIVFRRVLGEKPDVENEESYIQLILLPDCERRLRNWDFRCRETYSPYFCSHFIKDNFKVVNNLLRIHFKSRVQCI